MGFITVAVVVLIVGLVLLFIPLDDTKPASGRIREVGKIMFTIALFVILFCGCWGNHALVGVTGSR